VKNTFLFLLGLLLLCGTLTAQKKDAPLVFSLAGKAKVTTKGQKASKLVPGQLLDGS